MPEGSSSAAPVMSPGPRLAKKPFFSPFPARFLIFLTGADAVICSGMISRPSLSPPTIERRRSTHCCERRTLQRPLNSSAGVHDQADDKQNNEQEEKDFRDAGKRHGQSAEPQKRRDQGDHEEYQRVVKHTVASSLSVSADGLPSARHFSLRQELVSSINEIRTGRLPLQLTARV